MSNCRHIPGTAYPPDAEEQDAMWKNVCILCQQSISRSGHGEPWATDAEINEHIAEQQAELEAEWEDALHPEWRCPPRE